MYLEVNGIRFFSVSFGNGERTFVGHSGFMANWEVWLWIFESLSKDWHCISYDHRGAGETVVPPEDISREAMVDDLFAILDKFGIKKCVLGGESMGGSIAMRAALRQPERFEGLVLIGSSHVNPQPSSPEQQAFAAAIRTDYPSAMKGFMEHCFPENDSKHFQRKGYNMSLATTPEAAARLLESGSEGEESYDPSKIQHPTLIIHGDRDVITPLEYSRELADIIPNAELVVIKGAGHVPGITFKDEVVAHIRRFFES